MRRPYAFTLIEVMAVVALLALAATAVAWSFTQHLREANHNNAIIQIVRADKTARLAARRLGQPCFLHFDIPRQRITRLISTPSHPDPLESHPLLLSGCRLDRVVGADSNQTATAQIHYSSAGLSPSYAVRLASGNATAWLVFCGLTGQATLIHNEHQTKNLLAILATTRTDAP